MTAGLRVEALVKTFRRRNSSVVVNAVNGVSFEIAAGSVLGLVGESGSGKTTVGRCILRLIEPTGGRVLVDNVDLASLSRRDLRRMRARMQIVFQDPYESHNPRMSIRALIDEPLILNTTFSRSQREDRIQELLALVRLEPEHLDRFPHELSGGQLQRVGIARAIATNPDFVVLDEPTSSLDLSVRAGILRLLRNLQQSLGLTFLLISHDLHAVANYCDQVAVMYLGSIVEMGPVDRVFGDPQHPYTQSLLTATLPADPTVPIGRHILQGDVPSPLNLPPGCPFASRCPLVLDACLVERPAYRVRDGHLTACIRVDDATNKLDVGYRGAVVAGPRPATSI
jgi:oligopeptide/dipeptide ABC transporter ATP-binding protein